jgi:hypothetical protein
MATKIETVESASPAAAESFNDAEGSAAQLASGASQITALARTAVETYVLKGKIIEPEQFPRTSLLN